MQSARWHRFCSSPETEEEIAAMNRNYERLFKEMGGFTPEISKLIGWDSS